jgi:hypothetical protein
LKRLAALIGLIAAAWLTILFGLFAVFRLIFELTMTSQGGFMLVALEILRAILGAAVSVAWLLIWRKLASVYLWRNLSKY